MEHKQNLREKLDVRRSRTTNLTESRDSNSTTLSRSKSDERLSRGKSNASHYQKWRSTSKTHVDHKSSEIRHCRHKTGETVTRGHLSQSGRRLSHPNIASTSFSKPGQTKRKSANSQPNIASTSSSKPGQRKRKHSNNQPKTASTGSSKPGQTKRKYSNNITENTQRLRSSKNNKDGRSSQYKQNDTNHKPKRSRLNADAKKSGKDTSRKRGHSPSTSTQQPKKKPRKKINPFIYYNDRLIRVLSKDPSEIIMDLLDGYDAFCEFLKGEHLSEKSIEEILEILSRLYDTPYTQNFTKIFAAFKDAKFLSHLRRFILKLPYLQGDLTKKWTHLKRIIRFFNELLTRFPETCEDLPLDVLFTHADIPSLWQNSSNDDGSKSQDENNSDINTNNPTNEDEQKEIKDSILQLKSLRNEILRKKHCPTNTNLEKNPPPDDYRSIPVFPTREDIFPDKPPFLRKNIIRGPYTDVTHYLDVQFRLLREDYIAPIRNGVLEVTGQEEKSRSIHVYRNVRVVGRFLDQKSGGLLHRIQFDVSRMRRVKWEHSKRFKYGSLYCLFVDDQSLMYFVTLNERNVKDLKNGVLNVKFFNDSLAELVDLQQQFFMVESPAYFESYRHVLEGLQNFNKDNLPFQRYLVECNADVKAPVYLLKSTSSSQSINEVAHLEITDGISKKENKSKVYDLTEALSCKTANAVSVLEPSVWPSLSRVDLNDSQYKALKAALTQEFVVIQGPPGTGKTFIGLRIAKALLQNKSIWHHREQRTENEAINPTGSRKHSPMLVVCYTNHALDQFLEGIIPFTDSVTRVGGRGKSESLERFNLNARKKVSKESFSLRNLNRNLRSIQAQIEEEKKVTEAAVKELHLEEVEKFLNAKEKEQLRQWERVAYQMRVHRIEAWRKMQDETEDSGEDQQKKSSNACDMDETICNTLSPDSPRNTVDSVKNLSPSSSEKMNAGNSRIEDQGDRSFQEPNFASLCLHAQGENAEHKTGRLQELEEGEIPDSDDEIPDKDKEMPYQSNETRLSCMETRATDHLKELKQHTCGYTLSIEAQECTYSLIQDYPTAQSITGDIEKIEKNCIQGTSNNECLSLLTGHILRKPNETISQICGSLDKNFFNTMSPDQKSDSSKREDKEDGKGNVAMDVDMDNREMDKHNNNSSSKGNHQNEETVVNKDSSVLIDKTFNDESEGEKNKKSLYDLRIHVSATNNSTGDEFLDKDDNDLDLNERDAKKERSAVGNSDKSNDINTDDIEDGEIFDTDDDMSGSDDTSTEGDQDRRIDLTNIIAGRTDSLEGEANTKESEKQKPGVGKEETLSDPQNQSNEETYEVDLKKLSEDQRSDLYKEWVERYLRYHRREIDRLRRQHDETLKQISEIRNIQVEGILKNVDVIGMTTTGAAKHRCILQEIKPRIVIVEEAAEVLEGHVITALSSGTDHLILIGDHKQLKPNPEVYKLARKYKLDVSLFERMINNGLTCHSMNTQHRMRPEIADIMRIIYPELVDDVSVQNYNSITGIQHNVYFIDHQHEESGNEDLKSQSNQHEVNFVAALCWYLLLQGCRGNRITVLTMYTGQLLEIQRRMPKDSFDGIRISSVDNYQGEESDIIILSLVRSNKDGNIGFLNISNRVCVALSRAKKAMYCIGNISMMAKKNKLWNKIKNHLHEKSMIGVSLPLCCPNHPEKKIEASSAEDFKKAPDGGCKTPCGFRLPCGHACSLFCHPFDPNHKWYCCKEECLEELCDLKHRCKKRCHFGQDCGPCTEQVSITFSSCNHEVKIKCCERETIKCPVPCTKNLPCGHRCAGKCGEECNLVSCEEKINRTLECGHKVTMLCSKDVQYYQCREPCKKLLDCGHKCPGDCSACHKGTFHVQCKEPCKRLLVCSHECQEPCTKNCPPCLKECENRCCHSRCNRRCGYPCTPCRMPCIWQCQHHKCTKRCGEICDREKCDKPCHKQLKCGHQCVGICGDFCPRLCRICDKDELQTIFLGREDEPNALYIELVDCEHTFQVNDLDYWMEEMEENETSAIQLKVCPKCKTTIRRTLRYSNIVKRTLADIEKVKEKKLEEQRQLQKKKLKLDQRVRELTKKYPKILDFSMYIRVNGLPLDADACNTLENQLKFLSCLGKIDEMFFNGTENVEFKARSSKLLPKMEEITTLLNRRTLLTNQEVKDITENISFFTLSCQFEYMLWKIEKEDKSSALSEEMKSSIESAKEIMSRQDNAIDTDLAITNEERAVVARVIKDVSRKVGVTPLTPKERAGIVKAVKLSKGHWFKCPNGHIYAIGECGGAMEKSKCPECKEDIGGSKHKLVEGNQLAPEMDGATHAAWSDGANLLNYDPEELRRLQR